MNNKNRKIKKMNGTEAFNIYVLPFVLIIPGIILSFFLFNKDQSSCKQYKVGLTAYSDFSCYWNSLILIPVLWFFIFFIINKAKGNWGKYESQHDKNKTIHWHDLDH